jgi:hypothetical protein
MISQVEIKPSTISNWRELILRKGVTFYYPLYYRFRIKHKGWHLNSQTLLNYPTDSLGYALGQFLDKHQFILYDKCENHDIFHVILNYDISIIGELKLVFCLLGNGRYTLTNLLAGIVGLLFYPTCFTEFKQAYLRGRDLPLFHSIPFIKHLHQPFSLWSLSS